MGLTALDLGLRGAASGVFLLMVLVLLQLRPYNKHVLLGIAMSAGGAAFAIATAPFIPKSSLWWTLWPREAESFLGRRVWPRSGRARFDERTSYSVRIGASLRPLAS